MHIPDGFLAPPVWGGLAALSAPAVVYAARRTQSSLEESRVPLLGVMGAFLFAAQMINFPVAAGTSGHLLGGALLALTVGAAPAIIVLTAILAIQALVFQDGGLLALGANVFNMAVAGVLAGAAPARLLGRRWGAWTGGFLSVLLTGSLCLIELRLSGVSIPAQALWFAIGVFAITGALEGAITVAVLGALERLNPHWLQQPGTGGRRALAALTSVAVLLAATGFVIASAHPDGLEKVAGLLGIEEREIRAFQAPMAEYNAFQHQSGVAGPVVAGLSGLGLALALCVLLGKAFTRWRRL